VSKGFPAIIPLEKPQDRQLSAAMARMYDVWNPHEDRGNELYSNFRYSRITGTGKEDGVSRRDASKVVKAGDTYYVWYTRRETEHAPVGPAKCTDKLPAYDWDMADVYYATSKDGFHWKEQGVAGARNPKGEYGDRSATTPDILVYQGRYYLYFQSFTGKFDAVRGDYCDASMAWADSPDGPWQRLDRPVVELGADDEWDGSAIHDPYPLVYKGKIWLYYKGQPLMRGPNSIIRAQGVAFADNPEGPFVKSPLNPITNSGHETCLFPFREGIAAILGLDGPEKNTVQYAPDGLNFEVKSHVQMPPIAPGPFCPDAFADNGDGRGITWGLCHITNQARTHSFLARFDCDLSLDVDRPEFKVNNLRFDEHSHFQLSVALPEEWKERILRERAVVDQETI
jgi:hypothetical protein